MESVPLKENIQALKAQRGIKSDYLLAQRAGLHQPTLQRIMSGATKKPGTSTLKKLADFFSVTIDELLSDRKEWATTTGKFAPLTPQAMDLLVAFQRLSPERQQAYLDTIFMEAFMLDHMPWLRQGRPKKESYQDFERRMLTLGTKQSAKK
jgi:transcriptional regulator with XRE-family HTH domain